MFHNNISVKALKFTDLKKICVEEYKQEKLELTTDHIMTTIRIWDQSTWSLSLPRQIVIKKKISCIDLNVLLLKFFPDINVNSI